MLGFYGFYGFGAAAHLIAQVARWQGREVLAFTRPGDTAAQSFAKTLGPAGLVARTKQRPSRSTPRSSSQPSARWYLQVIQALFKENRFARGEFIGLGRKLQLADATCPAFLLPGDKDDITPHEQVFAARDLLGTPKTHVVTRLVPGGHIGLFMGRHTLDEQWPQVARWILELPSD